MDEQTNDNQDLDNLQEDALLLPGSRESLERRLSAYPTFAVRLIVVGLLIGVVVCLFRVPLHQCFPWDFRTRNDHRPGDPFAYARRHDRRMGNLVSHRETEGLGSWSSRRLE